MDTLLQNASFVVVLVFSVLVGTVLSAEPTLEVELQALKAFKNSITKDPLAALQDWNDSSHHCNWTGIKCCRLSRRVVEISVVEKQLQGSISPFLGNLSSLQVFDLALNSFTGHVPPQLGLCSQLTELNLSSNQLDGEIPECLASLRSLSTLDLSQNKFTGIIPENFFNISTLKHLNLSFNQLERRAPQIGSVRSVGVIHLQGNPSLCGGKSLHPCTNRKKSKGRVSKTTLIILDSVGSFVVLMLLLFAVPLFRRFIKKSTEEPESVEPNYTSRSILKRFDPKELEQATNLFNEENILGSSSTSTVYKGRLEDGQVIAVKNLKVLQFATKGDKSFNRELNTLAKLRHRNLVKLIGFAWESAKLKALVLEYMENGNLESIIHDPDVDGARWTLCERIDVLVSIAKVLVYLHSGYDFPIVHCDLKPSNILFDGKWDAHVSDLGTARILDINLNNNSSFLSSALSSASKGTIGYFAPEYVFTRKVTTKIDVFSFGVIVMEFLTRQRPTGLSQANGQPITLRQLVEKAFAEGTERLLQVVDPQLALEVSKKQQVEELIKLSLLCTCQDPKGRPDMDEVLSSLSKISKMPAQKGSQQMENQKQLKPTVLPYRSNKLLQITFP